ncbi:MAG: helix-hairpin-helix domain-containing protein [Janthinobacterium lividum]
MTTMTKSQRGYILVQALVVIAGLLALMAMLAADQRVGTQAVQDRLRQRRSDAAVDAAVARALGVVQNTSPSVVTLNDDWAQLGDNGNEKFNLGDATFRVQIIDAGALVNVNSAPAEQLQRLPLTQEQVHCLLDWREPKTQARPDGAKDDYYHALPTPYNAELGPLATEDELLLVKSWTGQTLYQVPQSASSDQLLTDSEGNSLPLASLLTVDSGTGNTRASDAQRINLGQPGADPTALTQAGISPDIAMQIEAQAPFTSFTTLLVLPIIQPQTAGALLDTVTFTTSTRVEGKINLNTASQAVLRTLPAVTPSLASAIVNHQSSGFRKLSELTTLPKMTPPLLAQIADSVTVGSDTWIVRAYGQSGGVGTAVEAVIGLRDGRAQIITWTRLSTTGLPGWWGWETQTSSAADAGDAH